MRLGITRTKMLHKRLTSSHGTSSDNRGIRENHHGEIGHFAARRPRAGSHGSTLLPSLTILLILERSAYNESTPELIM
jgi:hypothetical protein